MLGPNKVLWFKILKITIKFSYYQLKFRSVKFDFVSWPNLIWLSVVESLIPAELTYFLTVCITKLSLKVKLSWSCGSNGTTSALQAWSLECKPQTHQMFKAELINISKNYITYRLVLQSNSKIKFMKHPSFLPTASSSWWHVGKKRVLVLQAGI
jgi:hypothetical protein